MSGSGPAGEVTFTDIRRRLAAITARLRQLETGAAERAADTAAAREQGSTREGP